MGSCYINRPYTNNYPTSININYGPIYFNSNNNDDKNNFNLNEKEKYLLPIYKAEIPAINPIDIKPDNNIDDLTKQYDEKKLKSKIFYDDIKKQEEYILDSKSFITQVNLIRNNYINNPNISVMEQEYYQNLILSKYDNNELSINILNLSNKINDFEYLVNKQKNELNNLENNFQLIQNQLNDMKKESLNNPNLIYLMNFISSNNIKQQLYQSDIIINNLENNKSFYNKKKEEIKSDINKMQYITGQKADKVKTVKREKINMYNNTYTKKKNDTTSKRSSMLLSFKVKQINLFNQDDTKDASYKEPYLLKKNWIEVCYIKNSHDIYDINYELKAVGLPSNMNYDYSFLDFECDAHIDILIFEIDGKKAEFKYNNKTLKFNINLKNLESNNIHIKYRETPLYEKMTQDEKDIRTIYRTKKYGLSKNLAGRKAIFILINESNFEIISFDDEFFTKIKSNEYQWGGSVPEGGKETMVKMSKKQAKVIFSERHVMKTLDNSLIKNTVTKIPFCYLDGNNKIIKYNYQSKQTEKIKLNKTTKYFEVKYTNIYSPVAEFEIEGVLMNRCKGEWIINLTNEEIDSLIPPDFKTNKEDFKKISIEIINKYDEEHKDDMVVVPDVAKIGKWINKNMIYDISFKKWSELTATETYKLRRGVCHHYTKLFNALMYSLGYQVIYILGYAVEKKINFTLEDAHAWSLVKIDGKWLPFDATWGIFSGKLPVTHVFKQIDGKKISTMSSDRIEIEPICVQGSIS